MQHKQRESTLSDLFEEILRGILLRLTFMGLDLNWNETGQFAIKAKSHLKKKTAESLRGSKQFEKLLLHSFQLTQFGWKCVLEMFPGNTNLNVAD